MRNNTQIAGYIAVAIISFVLILHLWPFIVGALALFGFGHLAQLYINNNRK